MVSCFCRIGLSLTPILLLAVPAHAQTPPSPITAFALPNHTVDPNNPQYSTPIAMTTGPDGNLWFTESTRHAIGRITPTGMITEFDVTGTPWSITTGPDGAIWFTDFNDATIGRITVSGAFTQFAIPRSAGPGRIISAPDHNLWIATHTTVTRLDVLGNVTEFTPPTDGLPAFVRGIAVGWDGSIWFTQSGQDATGPFARLGMIVFPGLIFFSPDNGFIRGSFFDGITPADRDLWFTDSGGSPGSAQIGRIGFIGGPITFFAVGPVAVPGILPTDIVLSSDGSIWFTDAYFSVTPSNSSTTKRAGRIGRIAVLTGGNRGGIKEFPISIPGCGLDASHPRCGYPGGIVAGPDGNLWFAHAFSDQIMRIPSTAGQPVGTGKVAWQDKQGGTVGTWSFQGNSVRSENPLASGVPPEWQLAGTGDLDGNGTADLVWRHDSTGAVSVWLMNDVTLLSTAVISSGVPLEWQIAGLGDLNGDTKADIVWRNSRTGDVAVWWMNGYHVTGIPIVSSGVPLSWQITAIGDLDGDGHDDLLWRNAQTGDVAAWLMNSETVLAIPILSRGVPLAWQIAGLGDLDGDGKADVVWRHGQTGDVAVWIMNGATVVQAPVISSAVPLAWRIAKVADVSGDGKADLIWRHTQTGAVAEWLLNGTVVTQAPVIATGVPLSWQIQ
ncbi:MAG: hypothetical protein DMF90_23425 [Acidobacteria bacterium]|nr:MAG: hypothetical protein DMF90_23425 [Acidobacteriota bacterium]